MLRATSVVMAANLNLKAENAGATASNTMMNGSTVMSGSKPIIVNR